MGKDEGGGGGSTVLNGFDAVPEQYCFGLDEPRVVE